jgi:hypothetical protein
MSFISTKVNIKLDERQKEHLNAKLKQVIGCQESETEALPIRQSLIKSRIRNAF